MPRHVTSLLIATVVALVSCSSGAQRRDEISAELGVAFPVHDSPAIPDALVVGRLEERDGCLVVSPEEGRPQLVIWPHTLHLVEDSGFIAIADEDGHVLAHVGDTVRIGGGEIYREALGRTAIGARGIPERCATPIYWMGGEVERVAE